MKSIAAIQWIALGCFLASSILAFNKEQVLQLLLHVQINSSATIGIIERKSGSVLLKKDIIAEFNSVQNSEPVVIGSRVWTKENSIAVLSFLDGSQFQLNPGTLIEMRALDQAAGKTSTIELNVFNGVLTPVVVKNEFHVLNSGKITVVGKKPVESTNEKKNSSGTDVLVNTESSPSAESTPIPIPVPVEERTLKAVLKDDHLIKVFASSGFGNIRAKITSDLGRVVYTDTLPATQDGSAVLFEFGKIDPGKYRYDVEWIGNSFEIVSTTDGKFEIQDLRPPKVQVQDQVPALVTRNGKLGWQIFLNTDEPGLKVALHLFCHNVDWTIASSGFSKDSVFFAWESPDWVNCPGQSTYSLQFKNARGILSKTPVKVVDTFLNAPIVNIEKRGIQFESQIDYDSYYVEVSSDSDFNEVLYRQKVTKNNPFSFETSNNQALFIRAKGEWKGVFSPYSISKPFLLGKSK